MCHITPDPNKSLTRSYRTWLTARAETSLSFGTEVPGTVRTAISCIPAAELLRRDSRDFRLSGAARGRSVAQVEISCRVPGVRVEVACGGQRVTLEAIGSRGHLLLVAPFLDRLLEQDCEGRPGTHLSPAETVRAGLRSRLGRRILTEVVTENRTSDEAISAVFEGAASAAFVGRWRERLERAYCEHIRLAAARIWKWTGPLAVAGTAAAALLDLAGSAARVLGASETAPAGMAARFVLHVAFALLPVGTTWLVAAAAGLGIGNVLVGMATACLPQQGVKPLPWLAACVAAYAQVSVAHHPSWAIIP